MPSRASFFRRACSLVVFSDIIGINGFIRSMMLSNPHTGKPVSVCGSVCRLTQVRSRRGGAA